MQIPFTRIPGIEQAIDAATAVLKAGQFVAGKNVYEFEERWADVCGARFCAAVASGSAALELTLRATLPECSRVVIPALSFAATSFSVLAAGMEPVFVDVDSHGLLDWERACAACHKHALSCEAILPVYLYGQDAIVPPADELPPEVFVIGDMAQAHGLSARGLNAGCFSFYPSKNLGACGEAGAVVSDDPAIIDRVRRMSDYGRRRGDKHGHKGYGSNLRMDELQAAILLAKLPHLPGWNDSRQHMANLYRQSGVDSFVLPFPNVNHLYPVRVKDPTVVQAKMAAAGIATGTHYPYTLPELHEAQDAQRFDVARGIAHGHITLPMGPGYTGEEIKTVVEAFNATSQSTG